MIANKTDLKALLPNYGRSLIKVSSLEFSILKTQKSELKYLLLLECFTHKETTVIHQWALTLLRRKMAKFYKL